MTEFRFSWDRFKQFLKGQSSPHDLALGFSVGTFVGIMPGLGTPAAVLIAFLFGLNKPAAALGSLISNPFTVGFFYTGGFQLGQFILHVEKEIHWNCIWNFQPGWWMELVNVLPPFLVGLIPIALLIALLSYGGVRWAAQYYQARRSAPQTSKPIPLTKHL